MITVETHSISVTIVRRSVGRKGHWGLCGMNERAKSIGAHLQVWSTEGKGTEIEIRLPAAAAYLSQDNLTRYWRRYRSLRPQIPRLRSRDTPGQAE